MEWIVECFTTPNKDLTTIQSLTILGIILLPFIIAYVIYFNSDEQWWKRFNEKWKS